MFNWFRRNVDRQKVPEFSAVRDKPNRGLPPDLAEQEASQAQRDRHDAIANWLNELPRRPKDDAPLFVEILANDESFLTIPRPKDNLLCLPIFSSPFRAGDYVRTLLASDSSPKYLTSSPLELVNLLRDLREVGVVQFVLDRCPRCNTFCAIDSRSVTTADDAITCWSVVKATKLARMELYLTYAQASARAGELNTAREVLLETAGHVSVEDPRLHLILGQVAIALDDRELLRETKAFLQFFKFDSSERRLNEIIQSGTLDFEFED